VKLSEAATLYTQLIQAQGCGGASIAAVLRMFAKSVGGDRELDSILPQEVRAFLDGNRPLTRYWHRKHSALLGFYRFALARDLVSCIPLPLDIPRCRQTFQPYVYSESELTRLIGAVDRLRMTRIVPRSFRTLLLLLYGTGLRLNEALHLSLADVDLQQNLLTIRDTKFYKTRWVPVGPHLGQILRDYVQSFHATHDAKSATPLLICNDREPLNASGVRRAFARLRSMADVRRDDAVRYQPRLHDLRATFAVHRLTTWYRQGADVQKLLPQLSTYLGHASIAATQVYLPLTPELLIEASTRFERYVTQEDHHERVKSVGPVGQTLSGGVSGHREKRGKKHPAQLPRHARQDHSLCGKSGGQAS
jgi:integrase/recombinase XerD